MKVKSKTVSSNKDKRRVSNPRFSRKIKHRMMEALLPYRNSMTMTGG